MMSTGGGQETSAVSQEDQRITEIIGERALTGVHSDNSLTAMPQGQRFLKA